MNNEDIKKVIKALLNSYWYNRNYEWMLLFMRIIYNTKIESLGIRLTQAESKMYNADMVDDINIFWGALVLLVGDYGVNPASGWILPAYIPAIREGVMEMIQEINKDN